MPAKALDYSRLARTSVEWRSVVSRVLDSVDGSGPLISDYGLDRRFSGSSRRRRGRRSVVLLAYTWTLAVVSSAGTAGVEKRWVLPFHTRVLARGPVTLLAQTGSCRCRPRR